MRGGTKTMIDCNNNPTPSGGDAWWRRWYCAVVDGLRSALGTNYECIAIYRICLGIVLCIELGLRFQYLHVFYSDEGTLPLGLLLPKVDSLYKILCIHSYSGTMLYQQTLLAIQALLSVLLILGVQTKAASIGSWILYLSLTLRNTWLAFILDRYFHYLLFYSMFLPLDGTWTVYDFVVGGRQPEMTTTTKTKTKNNESLTNTTAATTFVTPATIAYKLFITWLYFDAGYGKYTDPMSGWTYGAQPLPALDTYVRHTLMARYLYGLLGPSGLRLLTPTVVYVELLGVPIALLCTFCKARRSLYCTIGLMCSMHIGIALTMTNTILLSSVACVAWCLFLPEGVGRDINDLISWSVSSVSNVDVIKTNDNSASKQKTSSTSVSSSFSLIIKQHGLSTIILLTFISGSIWFETMSTQCNQSMEHIWSSLLHNRWNVFIGAEEYVTWEIAPGRLLDGSIVDVWSKSDTGVSWDMPGTGSSDYYNTARRGRWRSFPYLADLDGEDGDALWSYLCREWDDEHNVNNDVGRRGKKLLRFNFFMLQADVLPNMGFSATRKRLIHQHDCLADTNFVTKDKNDDEKNFDFASPSLSEEL